MPESDFQLFGLLNVSQSDEQLEETRHMVCAIPEANLHGFVVFFKDEEVCC